MKAPAATSKPLPLHRYEGDTLRLSWGDGAAQLALPLGLRLGEEDVPFRRWAVRQGGVQSKITRGGGFFAVDYRRPRFHWRGRVGKPHRGDICYLRDVDVRGWTLHWAGCRGTGHAIDAATRWRSRIGIDAHPDSLGFPEPRYWFFRRPGTDASFLLSCAGPGYQTGVDLVVVNGRLTLTFLATDLAAAKGHLPDLYLTTGLADASEAAAAHANIVAKEGFLRARERGRFWWRRPTLYVTNATLRDAAAGRDLAERLPRVLDALAQRVPAPDGQRQRCGAILALDTAWADAEGDWNPACPLFADFKEFAEFRDRLRADGHALLLALAPFRASAGSLLLAESPWFFLRDAEGLPLMDDAGDHYLDYTHPETRAMMTDLVSHLLGDEAKQLGADGLCLAPAAGPDNALAAWTDSTWNNGERLWQRGVTMLAEQARAARPEALVELEAAEVFAKGAADRVAPLGLFGHRGAPRRAPRTLAKYGDPIPGLEGVRLAQSEADWARAAAGEGYWGVVYRPEGETGADGGAA